MNDDDLKALVARVTAEVVSEVKRAEAARGISVAEISAYAKELGGGKLPSAWKISYDTSSKLAEAGGPGEPTAWKITYDTSGKIVSPQETIK